MKSWLWPAVATATAMPILGAEPIPSAEVRFRAAEVREVPDFQRHVLPLLGRLGCNGRACHGSFQGQGGFRLSLFGYDFETDHEALLKGDEPRTNLKEPAKSLILTKPSLAVEHEGGRRLTEGTWQYRLLARWIESGAPKISAQAAAFDRLEVVPKEILFGKPGERIPLKVTAFWADGTSEDVTPLCRFRTNDEAKVEVDENGLVTCLGPGDTHVVAFYENGVVPVETLLRVSDRVGPKYPPVPTPTAVDKLVVAKLRKLGVVPSGLCTDEEFLRRVSLDLTGTLPTPAEVTAFLSDASPDKRTRKIDELLERPEYAAWWATRFCDVFGANSGQIDEQSFAADMARQWYEWTRERLRVNMPYDKIVEGMVLAVGRREGQSYTDYATEMAGYFRKDNPADFTKREDLPYYWMRRNLRTGEEKALAFSYGFLGVRLQCAQCHKHPFDQWTQDDFKHFQAFFNGISVGTSPSSRDEFRKLEESLGLKDKPNNEKQKIINQFVKDGKPVPIREVFVNTAVTRAGDRKAKGKVQAGRVITPKVLGGDEVVASRYADPREPLMDWMRSSENPYFARAIVNRIWANYFGIGIIEPADDLNLANPPSNEALLDYLTVEFVKHGYDLKWLHREIAGSRTYQLSCAVNDTNRLDQRNFSRALPRRLPAEVTYDALTAATAADPNRRQELATRMIGPTSGIIGRANNPQNYAMTVFGKPIRQTNCDCERSNEPSLLQTVFLRNDREMLGILERNKGWISEVRSALEGEAKAKENEERQAERAKAAANPGDEERRLGKAIAKLEADGKGKSEQAKRLKERLEHLKQVAAKPEKAKGDKGERAERKREQAEEGRTAAAPPIDTRPEALIREAFLRTLNRFPTPQESAKSLAYLEESPNRADGLRDLVWALLNTKEFIINH